MWAITGGAAIAGDDSYSACMREVYEEIGIKSDMDSAEVIFTLTRDVSIVDVWIIRQDFVIEECKLQTEEVSAVKWATFQEIRELQRQGQLHTYRYLEEISNWVESCAY